MNPSIAIVGRPNVGKSRLFNRLVGKRISIVHDRPGVTRDVVVSDSPQGFVLMDTGGIGMTPEMTPAEIQDATEDQAEFAIRAADLLLFVVDGRAGLLPLDETLALKFRKMGKQPVLVVNKMDDPEEDYSFDEFKRLGFESQLAVSAEHGYGVAELEQLFNNFFPVPLYRTKKSKVCGHRLLLLGVRMLENLLFVTVCLT